MLVLPLLALALLAGCAQPADAPKPVPSGASTDDGDTLIRLTRSDWFNGNPTYSVEVDGSGAVRYVGEEHVEVLGQASHTVAPSVVAGLVSTLRRAGYDALPDSLSETRGGDLGPCSSYWTDSATATTMVKTGGGEHAVFHYHGCVSDFHLTLVALEDEIDRALGTERWVREGWPETRSPSPTERRSSRQ